MFDTLTESGSFYSNQDCTPSKKRVRRARVSLRIAIVSAPPFPLADGIEAQNEEITHRLATMGHKVTLLSADPSGELPAEEMSGEVRVIRAQSWPREFSFHFAPAIYRRILADDYDLIHVQGCDTLVAPISMLAALRRRTPFVVTLGVGRTASLIKSLLRGVRSKSLAPLVRKAALHTSASAFEADIFSQSMGVPRSKILVIPNGVELPQRHKDVRPEVGELILSVGHLERDKGHSKVIEAMHKLQWRFPHARLHILGSEAQEAGLSRQVRKLRLGHKVTVEALADTARERLAALLAAADLVLLPGQSEAHPLALMEALALGRKILSTNAPAFRDFAQKGLVETISMNAAPIEIAEMMVNALNAPEQRLNFEPPTWDDCAGMLDEAYGRVIHLPE